MRALRTRVLAGPAVAFSNEQHRRRFAENRKHRDEKLAANRAYRAEHRDRLNAERRDKWRSDAALRCSASASCVAARRRASSSDNACDATRRSLPRRRSVTL